jgi:multiple antibiotic resistance protein
MLYGSESLVFSTTLLMVFSSFMPAINPFGGAMLFLSMTSGIEHAERAKLARRVAIYSFVVLLVSLFAGNIILKFFGISIDVLRVAGGAVLFSTGWKVLHEGDADGASMKRDGPPIRHVYSEMAFFPLTLPVTTGPGSISVAVAFGATPMHGFAQLTGCLTGIVLNCLLIWICYAHSDSVTRMLGAVGTNAFTRIFAFILICIGVSIFWTGFSGLWAGLPH